MRHKDANPSPLSGKLPSACRRRERIQFTAMHSTMANFADLCLLSWI